MKNNSINKLIMTGLMMALITVATYIIRIPTPTGGYIHIGDSMIFMAVLLLGWRYGAVAAGVGSALTDLLAGYAAWVPWTLIVKGIMAIIMGIIIENLMKKQKPALFFQHLIGMIGAGLWMVAGYYGVECIMYGSIYSPLASIPMNVLQFTVGAVIALTLSTALLRTEAKKYFTYK